MGPTQKQALVLVYGGGPHPGASFGTLGGGIGTLGGGIGTVGGGIGTLGGTSGASKSNNPIRYGLGEKFAVGVCHGRDE